MILLVEDHSDSAEVLARMLKARGHYVVTSKTAAASENILGTILPAVIVLDIGLPDRDGIDLLKELRSQPVYSLIPVVVFTADPALKTLQRARALGVDQFFVKGTAKWETVCDAIDELAANAEVRPNLSAPAAASAPPRPTVQDRPA